MARIYRLLADRLSENVWILNLADLRFDYTSPSVQTILGYTQAEIMALDLAEILPRASLEAVDAAIQAELARDENPGVARDRSRTILIEQKRKDGRRVWTEITASFLRDEDGRPRRIFGITRDITSRKRVEELMAQESAKLAAMISGMREGVVFADAEDRIVEVNEFFCRFVGVPREKILEASLDDLHRGEIREALRQRIEGFRAQWDSEALMLQREMCGAEVMLRVQPIYQGERYDGVLLNVIDVTELVSAQKEAERAREQAEEMNEALERSIERANRLAAEAGVANMAKSEFLATMSHEIRTPMNGIVGMTGLLLDSELSPEQREYAEIVRSSADALLELINDILDFSKIEAGKVELEVIEFDLRSCLEGVGDMLAQRAHEKGLELALFLPADLPTRVRGDPGRLRQILVNLVNNGIKFTEAGEVVVSVSLAETTEDTATVRFDVIDTGIGIPPNRQDRLFQAFSQVDSSTTRKYGGTGLGLAISRKLVEAMKGEIGVRSRAGEGSTFSFTAAFERPAGPEGGTESPPPGELRGMRVLVADASATNRRVLREQLEPWGCEAGEAESGEQVLTMLRTMAAQGRPCRLALVDHRLPGMEDAELARRIKAEAPLADTHLILVTSVPGRGDAPAMLKAGFDAALTKPVKIARLQETIAAVLGLQQAGPPAESTPLVTRRHLREAGRTRVRVLLADDNTVNQKVATRLLEKAGCHCDVVTNGREAVEALFRESYDIVFMDCQMPEMDGYAATAEIRRRENGSQRVPIIAMTAHAMRGDRMRCLEAGMDDHVAKPLSVKALYEVLDKHLAGGSEESTGGAQPAEPESLALDVGRIQEIADGDLDFEQELFEDFFADAERHVTELESSVCQQDVETVTREAHTLKGSAATAGANGMQRIASWLEQAGKRGDLGHAVELVESLRAELGLVRRVFEAYAASAQAESGATF